MVRQGARPRMSRNTFPVKKGFFLFALVLAILAGAGLASAALTDDLRAYWTYDDDDVVNGTNPTLLDVTNNSFDGTTDARTTTGATGLIKQAFAGDGTDGNISVNVTDFDGSITGYTFVGWFNADQTANPARIVKGSTDNTGFSIFLNADTINYRHGTGGSFVSSSKAFTDTTSWHMVTITWNGSTVTYYLDADTTGLSSSSTTSYGDSSSFFFGSNSAGSQWWDGELDQYGYWTRALNASEVSELYNGGNGSTYCPSSDTFNEICEADFSITAADAHNNTESLSNFTARIEYNGSVFTQSTTNGTITTNITASDGLLANITVSSEENGGYYNRTYNSHNTSSDLAAELFQLRVNATDEWSGEQIQNFTVFYQSLNFTTTSGLLRTNLDDPSLGGSLVNLTVNATGYFAEEVTNHNASTPLAVELQQGGARFMAFEKVTGENVTTFNVTINGTTRPNNETFTLSAGNYTAQFTAAGYYAQNLSIEILAETIHTFNFTDVYNHKLNVTITVGAGGVTDQNFTIDIRDRDNHSFHERLNTTSGAIIANLTHGNYTVWVNDSIHELVSENVTLNSSVNFTNLNIDTRTANSFNLTFFNETTNQQLSGVNVTIEVVSDNYAQNHSTSNGTLLLTLLTPDDYRFTYWADPDVPRDYYVTLEDQSFNSIRLYAIDEDISSFYVAIIEDESGNACQDNTVSLLRYYLDINGYRTVEMAKTDSQGQAVLRVRPNIVAYKIMNSGSCGDFESTPTELIDTSNTYTLLTAQSVLQSYQELSGVSTSLTYNNATRTFVYTWSDTGNLVTHGCLKITKRVGGVRSTAHDDCVEQNSGSTLYTIPANETNETTYFAQGYLETNTDFSTIYTDDTEVNFRTAFEILEDVGPFVSLLIVLVFITLGSGSAATLVLASVLGLAVSVYFGFIYASWASVASLLVLGGAVIYRMAR